MGRDDAAAIVDTRINQSNAAALATARQEKKRQAVVAGAQAVAVAQAKISKLPAVRALEHDEMAWIKAVAMGRAAAAIDNDSPYGNGAATWLVDNAGLAEAKQQEAPTVIRHEYTADPAMLDTLRQLIAAQQQADAVDAEVTETS